MEAPDPGLTSEVRREVVAPLLVAPVRYELQVVVGGAGSRKEDDVPGRDAFLPAIRVTLDQEARHPIQDLYETVSAQHSMSGVAGTEWRAPRSSSSSAISGSASCAMLT
jgi:hypothetical protein